MNADFHTSEYHNQLEAAKRFIMQYNDFLVVSHIQPDGDAASSTYAVGWMLKQLGKSFTLINEGPMPDKFNYLWGSDQTADFSTFQPNRKFQNVICVDCADFSRIGKVSSLFDKECLLLNIDHHPTNDAFGSFNVIHAGAAATVQILYDLAVRLHIPPSLTFGECIYTGLLTDTGGFRYANTSPEVLQIAADLLRIGVQGAVLAEQVLERMTFSQINLLQKTLGTLSFSHNRQVAWVSVRLEDIAESGASSEDLEGLVNYPRNVDGVEVGMLFKQRDAGTVKVSLRSAGKVDVSKIAQSLGGGGHVRASGCTINGSMEEAIATMVKEVGKAFE